LAALAAAVVLVSGAVAIALVVTGPSTRGPSADRPAPGAPPATGTSAAATTARAMPPGSRSDTTTTSPAQPIRPVPGNLLANGDFEQGLSGWRAFGGARVERVAVAHSGRWSLSIGPAQGVAPARPGIVSPVDVEARQGRTYQGRAWVRASAPGTEVTLALREQAGDGQSNADVLGISLPDGEWHEVAVVHQLHVAGARLSLELTGGDLGAGDIILVDEVDVTAP
jgi:Carbohydrate binding domain